MLTPNFSNKDSEENQVHSISLGDVAQPSSGLSLNFGFRGESTRHRTRIAVGTEHGCRFISFLLRFQTGMVTLRENGQGVDKNSAGFHSVKQILVARR